MNVTLPDNKLDKKSIIVYVLILTICIVSICVVVYVQFFEGKTVTTVGNLKGKSEEGYEVLKSEFNNLFTNTLQMSDEKYNDKKKDIEKAIVYTSYTNNESKDGSYNLDVNIPYININSAAIRDFNKEIKKTFQNKVDEIIKTRNKETIYSVEYSSYIQEDILSLIIRVKLKEGNSAQRVLIKTFNYDLKNDRTIELQELLELENVDKDYVQNKINETIKVEHQRAEDLKSMGKTIYERDMDSDVYYLSSISSYYFHDGSIYIIFPYGNNNNTSEMDIVII